MSIAERGMAFILTFFIGFSAFYVMYSALLVSIVAGICIGILLLPVVKQMLLERRKRRLLLEFRDLLDSLHGSFSSGKNLFGALSDTVSDMTELHGKKSMIAYETEIICDGIKNGQKPDELFCDFAKRSGCDDIRTFADTLRAAVVCGGNLRRTVSNCREIIGDRISVEKQIEDQLMKNKYELYILAVLPFVAVVVMRFLGNEICNTSDFSSIAIKTIAMLIFAFALYLGKKISSVKV